MKVTLKEGWLYLWPENKLEEKDADQWVKDLPLMDTLDDLKIWVVPMEAQNEKGGTYEDVKNS